MVIVVMVMVLVMVSIKTVMVVKVRMTRSELMVSEIGWFGWLDKKL